jgi:hypothetical protein
VKAGLRRPEAEDPKVRGEPKNGRATVSNTKLDTDGTTTDLPARSLIGLGRTVGMGDASRHCHFPLAGPGPVFDSTV